MSAPIQPGPPHRCPPRRCTAHHINPTHTRWSRTGVISLGLLLWVATACGGAAVQEETQPTLRTSEGLAGATSGGEAGQLCNSNAEGVEISEYDTSGDEIPDIRKVFRRVGSGGTIRLVLICRETDLNGDGVKDVVRYYTEEGRPLREESDRDFDGRMDEMVHFHNGRVVRIEQDTSGNGRVDAKVFYENGRPVRGERDLAARSTPEEWKPDQWEYYQNGRMVRVGTDIDGDNNVDRWDRDEDLRKKLEAENGDGD